MIKERKYWIVDGVVYFNYAKALEAKAGLK